MKKIIELLLERLRQIPDIKDVRIFNNQLQKMSQEDAMFYPLVLVELMNVDYQPMNGGSDVQYGTAEVRVHVVNDSLMQGADLGIYDLKDTVHRWLYQYRTGFFNPLQRTGETLDSDHDNLYDYQITYSFRFAEETQPLPDDTGIFLFDYTDEYTLNATPQPAPDPETPTTPPAGFTGVIAPAWVEEPDSQISYVGNWSTDTGGQYPGNNAARYLAHGATGSATLTFFGSEITIYMIGWNGGGTGMMQVDSNAPVTIDTITETVSEITFKPVIDKLGVHTIKLYRDSIVGGTYILNRIEIK